MDSLEMSASYRVEVSGWDAAEDFFVEKTTLEWNGDDQKEIALHSVLREGSVVFVRLLQSFLHSETVNFPIAYQAVKALPKDAAGCTRVCLEQLRPRETFRESAMMASDSETRVA